MMNTTKASNAVKSKFRDEFKRKPLIKKIEEEVKKAKKQAKDKTVKSDRDWKGKNILDDGAASEKETPNTAGNYGTVYAERDGVGYCYQNGEVVSSNNYNNRKA